MNWIKSNEREPSTEGKYHCKYNGVKVVLNFVKIQPNRDVCDDVDTYSPYAKGVYFDSIGVPKTTREPYPLPTLRIKQHSNDEPSAVIKPQYWHPEDFVIENYQSHPAIKAPLSN